MNENKKDYSTHILLIGTFLAGILFTYIGSKITSYTCAMLGILLIMTSLSLALMTSEAWRSTNKF